MLDNERIRSVGSRSAPWLAAAFAMLSILQSGCSGTPGPDSPDDLAGDDLSQYTRVIYDRDTDTTRFVVSLSYESGGFLGGGIGENGTRQYFRPSGADRLEVSVNDEAAMALEPVEGFYEEIGATVAGWPEGAVTFEYVRGSSVLRRLNVQLLPLPDVRLTLERDVLSKDEALGLLLELPGRDPTNEPGRDGYSESVRVHVRRTDCLSALSVEREVYEAHAWAGRHPDPSSSGTGLSAIIPVEDLIADPAVSEGLDAGTFSECQIGTRVSVERAYNPPRGSENVFVASSSIDFPPGTHSYSSPSDLLTVSVETESLGFTVVP